MPAFDSTVRLRQLNQPELSGYIVLVAGGIPSSTGTLTGVFYPYKTNPSGYITTGQTGSFITQSALDSNYYSTLGYVASNYYPLSNPYGYITSQSLTGNAVWTTGDQNISGAKNFYIRPSVNGSGVFLQGESLITNAVYTTGDQTIAGNKTFTGISYFNSGAFSNRPTVNGTGVLLSGEASSVTISNVVYQTGNQTISGNKTFTGISYFNSGAFSNRPTVNGTGVLLSGEASSVTISDVVYQTGNQTISGNKTFTGISYFKSGAFSSSLTISGVSVSTGVSTGSFVTTGQTGRFITTGQTGVFVTTGQTGVFALSSQVVYTTGNQTISGIKTFQNNLIANDISAATGGLTFFAANNLVSFNNSGSATVLDFGLDLGIQSLNAIGELVINAGTDCSIAAQSSIIINPGNTYYTNLMGGKVGINTYSPTYTLDVNGSGNFRNGLYVNGVAVSTGSSTSTNSFFQSQITMPTGANTYAYIGRFTINNGAQSLGVSASVSDNSYSVSKFYNINSKYFSSPSWYEVIPSFNSGPYYGGGFYNDFCLDISGAGSSIDLRLRNKLGSLSGNVNVNILNYLGSGYLDRVLSFSGITTTGTDSASYGTTGYDGGIYVTTGQTGSFATTGYVTGVSGYLKSLISASSAGVNSLSVGGTLVSGTVILSGINGVSISTGTSNTIYFSGQTGSFVTTGQTGNANTLGGQSGSYYLNYANMTGSIATSVLVVYQTGNQTISGNKTFTGVSFFNSGAFSNRPTVNGTGVLLSGEASSATVSNVVYTTGNGTTQTISGSLTVTGHFSANTKSFLIDHPTIPGKKLQYGVIEGPEHSIFIRGKLINDSFISFPHYWSGLVDLSSITVSLTPIGAFQNLYVNDVNISGVKVVSDTLDTNCYYHVFAERKDIPKLEVEV